MELPVAWGIVMQHPIWHPKVYIIQKHRHWQEPWRSQQCPYFYLPRFGKIFSLTVKSMTVTWNKPVPNIMVHLIHGEWWKGTERFMIIVLSEFVSLYGDYNITLRHITMQHSTPVSASHHIIPNHTLCSTSYHFSSHHSVSHNTMYITPDTTSHTCIYIILHHIDHTNLLHITISLLHIAI